MSNVVLFPKAVYECARDHTLAESFMGEELSGIPTRRVPILEAWQVQAEHHFIGGQFEQYVQLSHTVPAGCFAIDFMTASMSSMFGARSLLVFTPHREPAHGDFVLFSLPGKRGVIFRQIHQTGSSRSYITLNGGEHYPQYEDMPVEVHGVLIEARRRFYS